MFSEEQIKRLNEISRLTGEKQKIELNEFLKQLTPEQINYLKNQQKCLMCAIANKEMESNIVYEDDNFMAVLDINPANIGHTLVMPKKHYEFYWQIHDIDNVVRKLAPVIANSVRADGINIHVANGIAAGQRAKHAVVHIIPRFSDDKIEFRWEGKKITKQEIDKIKNIIVANIDAVGKTFSNVVRERKIEDDYWLEDRIP